MNAHCQVLALFSICGLLATGCTKTSPNVSVHSDDPNDEVIAFVASDPKDNGLSISIYSGKLHSGRFLKLCAGDNPRVSLSGKYIAFDPPYVYNPKGPNELPIRKPQQVIEIATGKLTPLADFQKLGLDRFSSVEINARQSLDGRVSIENYKKVGALYFHPDRGEPFRLTPDHMAVSSTPIWISRTGEVLFSAFRVSAWKRWIDPDDDDSEGPDEIYLIKPNVRDWTHASKADWEAVRMAYGLRVSSS